MANSSAWALSEMAMEEITFTWSIKGFAAIINKGEELYSPIFDGNLKTGHQWRLYASPKHTIEGVEYLRLGLDLFKLGDAVEEVWAKFQISLCDPHGQPSDKLSQKTSVFFQFKAKGKSLAASHPLWSWPKFCKTADFDSPRTEIFNTLFVDDTIIVRCHVWICGELYHQPGTAQPNWPEVTNRRNAEVVSDLQALRTNEKYSDFAIATPTKTFMVQKSILSVRSSVFRAMLENPMMESDSNELKISDFDEEVVNGMIDYIYSGTTNVLKEKPADLLRIADKYDLVGLKESCELFLCSDLKVENAVDLVVLADLCNVNKLKEEATRFIARNKKEVRKTEAFQRVFGSNPFVDVIFS